MVLYSQLMTQEKSRDFWIFLALNLVSSLSLLIMILIYRFVYLITKSPRFKVAELQKTFSRYGINVLPWEKNTDNIPPDQVSDDDEELKSLLMGEMIDRTTLGIKDNDKVSIVAVVRESTCLKDPNTAKEVKPNMHLQSVNHVSDLRAIRMLKKSKKLLKYDYSFTTEGYIDLKRRGNQSKEAKDQTEEVFGWDQKFKLKGTHYSYQDLVSSGLKVSSRDMNVSRLVRDILYYKKRTALKFTDIRQDKSIDFGVSDVVHYIFFRILTHRRIGCCCPKTVMIILTPYKLFLIFPMKVRQFTEGNKYLNNPVAIQYRIPNMYWLLCPEFVSTKDTNTCYTSRYTAMCNNGAFFRSAINRREKTSVTPSFVVLWSLSIFSVGRYWLPGLNAGVPYTPKKDAIHEITFMTHDFGHFTVPDLVFEGKVSTLHKNVYITWRMMSEAVTMIMADMIFVHSLTISEPEYDYEKRKIFPLLTDTGIDLSDSSMFVQNVERLLEANVEYCLLGRDEKYRAMLAANGVTSLENLEQFKAKYMPFFVEDFRWTVKNHSGMSERSADYQKWWQMVKPIRDAHGLCLKTVSEAIENGCIGNSREELVWNVFENVIPLEDAVLQLSANLLPSLIGVLDQCIRPGWLQEEKIAMLPEEQQLSRAFARWLIGQAAIFSKFDFLPESKMYFNALKEASIDSKEGMTLDEIDSLRSFFDQYLSILRAKNLISIDDENTYSTFYPLFEPFYVFYDHDLETYTNLEELSTQIYNREISKAIIEENIKPNQHTEVLQPRSCYAAATLGELVVEDAED
eukprot:jgi/Bigna1/86105/estExt_fgenesh1_pg.C_80092